MRRYALAIALLALLVAGSASAASRGTVEHVRTVKHAGASTATLTYTDHRGTRSYTPITGVTLRIQRGSRLVLRRQICEINPLLNNRCRWITAPSIKVLHIGPNNTPAFALDVWNGGNHCCTDTFIATLGSKPAWITREWSGANGWSYYRIKRVGGRTLFVTGDGRFFCVFSVCAGATVPIRVFAIGRSGTFVNVTRQFPGLIRANAHSLATNGGDAHMTIKKQGSGVLAAWCGDEYLLHRGAHCARVLAYAVRHHPPNMQGAEPTRGFVRALNRDLERWGYKR